MQISADYIIAGAGLTGATIARALAEAGREVCVLERKPFVGGNVRDTVHESGIRYHVHGPHYFRTGSSEIWRFANRFGEFHPFTACLRTSIDGALENWPIAASYIRRTVGEDWRPVFEGEPRNFEEACLALMPEPVYRSFVKGYTEKQWGTPATTLAPGLVKRFDVRHDDDPRLFRHAHQGVPADGYSAWVERMLAGVPVVLSFDALKRREEIQARRCFIFTGPIDEYFGFRLGRLRYRSQRRALEYLPDVQDTLQPVVQVNYPAHADGAFIRRVEWKHLMPAELRSRITGTLVTTEFPVDPDTPEDYEYPFPDQRNTDLFQEYEALAAQEEKLLICGRLGEYRYYDMDQAIGRAMVLARRLLES